MANYESCTRTNYFAVTDEEKLKNIVAHIKWGGGELDFLDKENGKWGFGGYGSISGLYFNDVKFYWYCVIFLWNFRSHEWSNPA